jgi:hypothetical protein
VIGLAALGVALPLAVNAWAGALDVPYSDVFTFRRTALAFHDTGVLRLGGWSIMTFVGQLLAVQPVLALSGGASWAFPATAAAFTLLAIAAGYALARRFLSPARSTAAVLLVLVFPGVLLEAPTFMTDIPAMAMELLCLALAARALDPSGCGIARPRLFGLSLAAGIAAFSIREFGLAAPVAALVCATIAQGVRRRGDFRGRAAGRLGVAWAATLAACLGLYLVTSGLPGQAPAQLHVPGDADVLLARQAIATTALAVAPALAVAVGRWLASDGRRDSWSLTGAAVGLVAATLLYAPELVAALEGRVPALLVGNVLSAAGSTGSGAGAGIRPVLFVPPTWRLLNLLALVAVEIGFAVTGATAAAALRRIRRGTDVAPMAVWLGGPSGLLLVFSALYLGGTLAFGVVASLYDRYLWPLILPLGILLLGFRGPDGMAEEPAPFSPGSPAAGATRRPPAAGTTAPPAAGAIRGLTIPVAAAVGSLILVAFAGASLALLVNRAAYDVARWNAGEALVAAGYPAERVDVGYEWVGDHASEIVIPDRGPGAGERWYQLIVPDYRPCAVVSSSSLEDAALRQSSVDPAAYRLLLIAGPEVPLYVYRTDAQDCP